jgi:ATP-dependent DNA helicase
MKSTRSSTPGSISGRTRQKRLSYREIGDREFNAKLRRLENGLEEEEEEEATPGDTEQEEIERAKTIKLASM